MKRLMSERAPEIDDSEAVRQVVVDTLALMDAIDIASQVGILDQKLRTLAVQNTAGRAERFILARWTTVAWRRPQIPALPAAAAMPCLMEHCRSGN